MGDTWDIFLSHSQASGGDQAKTISLLLEGRKMKVWYDQKVTSLDITKHGMAAGINGSATFLVFLSEGIFTRPYCRFELLSALCLGKPIILVCERDSRHQCFDVNRDTTGEEVPESFRPLASKLLQEHRFEEYHRQEHHAKAMVDIIEAQVKQRAPPSDELITMAKALAAAEGIVGAADGGALAKEQAALMGLMMGGVLKAELAQEKVKLQEQQRAMDQQREAMLKAEVAQEKAQLQAQQRALDQQREAFAQQERQARMSAQVTAVPIAAIVPQQVVVQRQQAPRGNFPVPFPVPNPAGPTWAKKYLLKSEASQLFCHALLCGPCAAKEVSQYATGEDDFCAWMICGSIPYCWPILGCIIASRRDAMDSKIYDWHKSRGDPMTNSLKTRREHGRNDNSDACCGVTFGCGICVLAENLAIKRKFEQHTAMHR